MAVKNCCIEKCDSSSTREEDVGVTYHKYPKDVVLCNKWINVTHLKLTNTHTPAYVCSRHFRKNDFKVYKASKYVLKSDAIPSIFSWVESNNMESINMDKELDISVQNHSELTEVDSEEDANLSNDSKSSDIENLDAIKKFIESQEKAIQASKSEEKLAKVRKMSDNSTPSIPESCSTSETLINVQVEENKLDIVENENSQDDNKVLDPNVMDAIISESEANNSNAEMSNDKKTLISGEKGSMALSVGSKVEAKDFGENWHAAEIIEVDFDEMEVLVHYEVDNAKHDEWICVSSPRLRPIGSGQKNPPPAPKSPEEYSPREEVKEPKEDLILEHKQEEKPKHSFEVGERCLARWKDSRRFSATITGDLGDGTYEVVFDDGFLWKCRSTRLFKLKESSRSELSINTSLPSAASSPSPQSPVNQSEPSMAPTTQPILPYHTHLFDPTRDYLGSKSERREMKRKLNIKEIFNIGQKKKKVQKTPDEKPKRVIKKKPKELKTPKEQYVFKKEIPDAVASIIGTINNEVVSKDDIDRPDVEVVEVKLDESILDGDSTASEGTLDNSEQIDNKMELDPVIKEEIKLEKFDSVDDAKEEEVIDKIKAAITKLEDGLSKASSPKPEIKPEPKLELKEELPTEKAPTKVLAKVKKSKKLRLIREKKVKKQVAKVKSELEAMKRQVEEMRKQMQLKSEPVQRQQTEMPETFLLPGEWCCKWVNGQPVGKVCEVEGEVKVDSNNQPVLPRRSVQVDDKRLPPGWTKHMVRRSFGNSAGKWDVVLIGPNNRRFHTKNDMRNFFENNLDESLRPYENALMDFGVHLKLARRMGWYKTTPGGEDQNQVEKVPVGLLSCTSPLVKKKSLSLKKSKEKKRKALKTKRIVGKHSSASATLLEPIPEIPQLDSSTLEEGYVYVGLLKVQIIENLLRCPADGCFKNFRNNTLLQMHIKHYHRELCKMLGSTPQVLDLAHARTKPTEAELAKLIGEAESKTLKVKITRPPKRVEEKVEPKPEIIESPYTPVKSEAEPTPKSPDSPKLRNILTNKVKRPRVLLPVRKPGTLPADQSLSDVLGEVTADLEDESIVSLPPIPMSLDFENVISSHTVTKPWSDKNKRRSLGSVSKKGYSEDEDGCGPSDVDTQSSFPRSGTPDSKIVDGKLEGVVPMSSESAEEQKDGSMYMYTETGERIKLVHMKREEIINCHCGFREEDGLMVQCELCLCWQHALCHNIRHESEVPDKYTCSICLNPRRGRRSRRFVHDQDRLYEGLLPGAAPDDALRREHELAGNLLRLQATLHALRVKYHVATKKDHPKLYLWAKDWETNDISATQDNINSDYSDLNIMINNIDKENLPVKPEEMRDLGIDIKTPPLDDQDSEKFTSGTGQLGSQTLLSGLLSSPGGVSLDLPISTSELERLAKTVQEESGVVLGPQPEAAIENSACRERLLQHLTRCQALVDARLDSIEAQVAELESQDPSFEDDETVDYLPRTKQTIRMLMRDLDTMEELGIIT